MLRNTAYRTITDKGMVTSNEFFMLVQPRAWTTDGTSVACLYAPALSAGAPNMAGWFTYTELVKRGFACIATDLGDTPTIWGGSGIPASVGGSGNGGAGVWGNDASLAKMDSLYNFATQKMKANSRVVVMGGSHGGSAAIRWAAANRNKVMCLLLGIPTVDMQSILSGNLGTGSGYAASVQAAWGLGGSTTLPATSSGYQSGLPVTGVACSPMFTFPVRNYFSDTDPICLPSTQAAFQAGNPTLITNVSMGSVGHNLLSMPVVESADWVLSKVRV